MNTKTIYKPFITSTSFTLDENGTIIGLDTNWEQSLLTDSPELKAERLLGTNLFSYVNGDSTQIWLGTVLQKALVSGYVEKEYRCDSPSEMRWCKMIINQAKKNLLHVTHHIFQLEEISISYPKNNKHPKPNKNRFANSLNNIIVCSNCCKIRYYQHFIELVDYCTLTGQSPTNLRSKHNKYVICPECYVR